MSNKARTIAMSLCFFAAGALFIFAIFKVFFKSPKMAASTEVWISRAQDPKTGKTLVFQEFPLTRPWTQVCIFQGHSTDAQMDSVLLFKMDWKLSDRSKATTHKDISAIVFIDEDSKSITHVFDIPNRSISFDKSVHQKCFPRKKSVLHRLQEATSDSGPVFGQR